MEFRKVFDTIPQQFDKWRPRYCDAVFRDMIDNVEINLKKNVLEIGPGTGQATEPILKTGCDYTGIELGEHLARYTRNKFEKYPNCHIINGDFETYSFGNQQYDFIYSAATIQWIPEEIAFTKTFNLLKNGGFFAMMFMEGEYKTPNENLYNKVQQVYEQYFRPTTRYKQEFTYENAVKYGFVNLERKEYPMSRRYTADEYVQYIGTHADHLTLKEPEKRNFYEGVHNVIVSEGNIIAFNNTVVLYLVQKP